MGEYTELVGRLVTEGKEWSHAKVRAERLGKSIAARSQCQSASAIMAEAATAIETLQAKVERLREALSEIGQFGQGGGPSSGYICANMAQAALEETR